MAGVRDQFASEEEMTLGVLNAGVDLLLDLAEPVKRRRLSLQVRSNGAA